MRKKTKIMSFNFSKKYDFLPKLKASNKQLDVVYSHKLLGVILTSNCKWHENTSYIVKKANRRIWYLRRLKALGASVDTLMDQYHKSLRSVLEFGAPLWTGSLTKTNIADIEKVQKTAFKVILGHQYTGHLNALNVLGETTLEERRLALCKKYAKKCSKNPKMTSLFPVTRNKTRYGKKFIEPIFKSKRATNGCVPFLIRLLNED